MDAIKCLVFKNNTQIHAHWYGAYVSQWIYDYVAVDVCLVPLCVVPHTHTHSIARRIESGLSLSHIYRSNRNDRQQSLWWEKMIGPLKYFTWWSIRYIVLFTHIKILPIVDISVRTSLYHSLSVLFSCFFFSLNFNTGIYSHCVDHEMVIL